MSELETTLEMPAVARYNRVAVLLHGLLACALLAQLTLGFWMEGVPKDPPGVRMQWFNFHKSVGIVLALLIVGRALWRLMHGAPAWPESMSSKQQAAAKLGHGALYACMILMPVSGFLGSSFTPYPIKFFGTALPRLWEASAPMKDLCSFVHTGVAFVFCALIAGHISFALWHAWRRDGVIQRMSWH